MPETTTLAILEDHWLDQWHRADEICRLLEQVVPRRDERPSLSVVRDDERRDASDPA